MSSHSVSGQWGKLIPKLRRKHVWAGALVLIWTALHGVAVYWTVAHQEWIGLILNSSLWLLGLVLLVGGGSFLARRQQRLERAQSTLQASEEHFRVLYEQAPVAYQSLDNNGRVLEVNQAWVQMLGFEKQEVVGRPIAEFVAPEQRQQLEERLRSFMTSGQGCGGEFMFVHKNGTKVLVAMEGSVLCENDRNLVRAQCVLHNITERRKVEQALRDAQASLLKAQRIAQLGSWETGLKHPANSRVYLWWSDEVYRIFGHEPGAFVPSMEGFFKAVVAEDLERVRAAADEAIQTCLPYCLEHRIVRPDGEVRYVREQAEVVCDTAGIPVKLVGTVQDITVEKQAEANIREKEQFISAVVRNSPDFIIVFDLQSMRYIYRNRLFPSSLNYTEEEVARIEADGVFSILHPEDRPKLIAHFGSMAQAVEGVVFNCQFRIRGKQGGYSCFLARDTVFKRDASGRVLQILSVAEDITERERAQVSLRASEERFRRAVIESPFPTILHADDGSVLQISRSWTEVSGYEPEEIATIKDWTDRAYGKGEEGERVHRKIARIRSIETRTAEGEFNIRTKDGSQRIWDFSSAPLGRLLDGRRIFMTMAMDVTERKKAETERVEMLARLEFERQRMPIACIQIDNDFRITDWNPAAERTFGFTKEEVFGKSPNDLFVPAASRAIVEELRHRMAGGDMAAHRIVENVTKDGRPIFCEWHNTPLRNGDGTLRGFLTMAVDLTERKHLEDQLRQAQKMEAVGQLAGGIAHDFNNILGSMLMQLNLLQTDSQMPPALGEGLRELETGANRAAELTRQLLTFSRRQILQIKPVDLNIVIAGMFKMLRRLLREDIALDFKPECESAGVAADTGMMEQILMNLVVNARDAISSEGQVLISTRIIENSESMSSVSPYARPGRFVCLSVRDSGMGMDQATLKRIFEPFFSTKEAGKGTGLGLATVYGIVKQHGGWINVDSAPGKGATFRVCLPTCSVEATACQSPVNKVLRGGSETVLLVEDDTSVRTVAKLVLERAGYRVLEASDSRNALRMWEKEPSAIDLLLTDMVMPGGMTGLDLARRLQTERPGLNVILSSGYSLELSAVGALTEQQITYLPKPCNSSLLLQTVRQCLDSRNLGKG